MSSTKKPSTAPKQPFKPVMPPLWQAARLDGKQRNMGIKNLGKQRKGKRGDRAKGGVTREICSRGGGTCERVFRSGIFWPDVSTPRA